MKKYLSLLAGLVLVTVLVLSLTACSSAGNPEEMAEWFAQNISEETIVIDENTHANAEGKTVHSAYLECNPVVTFDMWQEGDEVKTNFHEVYGQSYLIAYQLENKVLFMAAAVPENTGASAFEVKALYADRAELDSAFDEVMDFQTYVESQQVPCSIRYDIVYATPLSDDKCAVSVSFDGKHKMDEAEMKIVEKCAEADLALWTSYYCMNEQWFNEEELKVALTYATTEEYRNNSGVFTVKEREVEVGGKKKTYLSIEDDNISFGQLYNVLKDANWETLRGSAEDFTFTGINGSEYAFSYELVSQGDGALVNVYTKDGKTVNAPGAVITKKELENSIGVFSNK